MEERDGLSQGAEAGFSLLFCVITRIFPPGAKIHQTGLLADPLEKTWFSGAWGFSALHKVAPRGVQLCVVPAVLGVQGKRNQCKHEAPTACCAASKEVFWL